MSPGPNQFVCTTCILEVEWEQTSVLPTALVSEITRKYFGHSSERNTNRVDVYSRAGLQWHGKMLTFFSFHTNRSNWTIIFSYLLTCFYINHIIHLLHLASNCWNSLKWPTLRIQITRIPCIAVVCTRWCHPYSPFLIITTRTRTHI